MPSCPTNLGDSEDDDGRSSDGGVAIRKGQSAGGAIDAKAGDCIGALVAAIEEFSAWIDGEAAGIIAAGPGFACKGQLTGSADLALGEAVDALREAGHTALADRITTELVGRNVIADRWTFQIVEDYDDGYWSLFRDLEREARQTLTGGLPHLHEAKMKEDRRTHGHPDHTAGP